MSIPEAIKIILVGYGKMGRAIEQLATSSFKVVAKVNDEATLRQTSLAGCIVIDFSTPEAFKNHYDYLTQGSLGVVVGTTGWLDEKDAVIASFKRAGTKMVYASNFSLGVYIFSLLVAKASALTAKLLPSSPYILEMHHKTKLDRPSGTALQLKELVKQHYQDDLDVASIRAGELKGLHQVGLVSPSDKITLQHEAFSREGFARGALLAARGIAEGKVSGVVTFNEWLDAVNLAD